MGHSRGEMWWLPWKYHVILERLILTNFILFDTFQPHCWQTSRSASCFGSKFEKLSCLAFPQFSLGSCGAWPWWPLWCLMCPPRAAHGRAALQKSTIAIPAMPSQDRDGHWRLPGVGPGLQKQVTHEIILIWNHMKSYEFIWNHMGLKMGYMGKPLMCTVKACNYTCEVIMCCCISHRGAKERSYPQLLFVWYLISKCVLQCCEWLWCFASAWTKTMDQ